MKKKGMKTAAAIISSAVLSLTGITPVIASEPITDYYTYSLQAKELETFNILYTQNTSSLNVLTNLIDGLVSADNHGNIVPAIAQSWEQSDDGLTWTFHLRDDVKWVDVDGSEKADCTAQDFLTGLEWILNYYKNDSANTSMPISSILGANDYYEYTEGLSEEDAVKLTSQDEFSEMVGIKAVDDYTLEYTCIANIPYFPSMATYNCLYPVSQSLIDELGVDGFKACTNESMWYNGCYTMTQYVQNNEKVLTKNPLYWDKDCTLFDSVTIKMAESTDNAFQLYQNGEVDNVNLSESNLSIIYGDSSSEYYDNLIEKLPDKVSYQFHFNYDRHDDDGNKDVNWNTAISNEAFRKCFYYGLDMGNYYKRTNAVNPYKCYNNSYTMKGFVYMSDGTDYVNVVQEKLNAKPADGESMVRCDKDLFEQYKEQAMEELSAKGVTFPVKVNYYVAAGSQTALDSAQVLKQTFSDCFGDDFIVLEIGTYTSSYSAEIRSARKQAFIINGWSADYADPESFLAQEVKDSDNASFSVYYSNIADNDDEELNKFYDEYTQLVNEANAITDDMDKRYDAFADAEAFLIEHVLVMPCNYSISWQLTHVNDYSKINAMYGIQNNKYKNWETSVDAYTTEEYQAFEAAFCAENVN